MMVQKLKHESSNKLKPITITINPIFCFRCGFNAYPVVKDGKVQIPLRCPNRSCNSPYYMKPLTKKSGPKYKKED